MVPFDVVTGRDYMVSLLVTTSNGTILIPSLLESPTYRVKLKKLF